MTINDSVTSESMPVTDDVTQDGHDAAQHHVADTCHTPSTESSSVNATSPPVPDSETDMPADKGSTPVCDTDDSRRVIEQNGDCNPPAEQLAKEENPKSKAKTRAKPTEADLKAQRHAKNTPVIEQLALKKVRIDGNTQSRVSINHKVVKDYIEVLEQKLGELPPVKVFFDGASYWLADGYHRYWAHQKIGMLKIDAVVENGNVDDAKLYAYGANKDHGLRRTAGDKRKAIAGMLADFGDWSDSKIAKHVGVDHKTVAAHRPSILGNSQVASTSRTVERNGRTYKLDTAKIGKTKSSAAIEMAPCPEAVTPVTSELPATMQGYDANPGVASNAAPMLDLPHENADPQAQVATPDAIVDKAELQQEIDARTDVEQKLQQEVDKATEPENELNVLRALLDELRAMVHVNSNADLVAAVRALLKGAA